MYQTQNKRQTLTRRLLKESLIRLLKEKEIRKISVTELCQDAGINRTTFYSHYSSQYDVLEDMENTMLQEIQAMIAQYQNEREWNWFERIEAVCKYLKENSEMAKAVLQNNGVESEFASALFQIPEVCHFASDHLPKHYDEVDQELIFTCFSRGGYSVIRQWLVEELPKTPTEIAALTYEIATRGWIVPGRSF
ncbi:MAG: TetR/AcrR family transcriptional regulator [Candidatus Onthomonas sp.]